MSANEPGPPPIDDEAGTSGEMPSGEDLLQPAFPHPPWAVGMVLVIAIPFLVLGVLGHPIWLLLGSPFILVLIVWVAVRIVERRRARALPTEPGSAPPER